MIEKVTGGSTSLQSFLKRENSEINQEGIQVQNQNEGRQSNSTQQEPVTKEKMESVVRGMNEFLTTSNTHLKFEFHDKLQEYYVTIVDDKTKEVIKEIPSKKMLDMHAALTEFIGLIVDKKI
jgi:flagellar protein FlaG